MPIINVFNPRPRTSMDCPGGGAMPSVGIWLFIGCIQPERPLLNGEQYTTLDAEPRSRNSIKNLCDIRHPPERQIALKIRPQPSPSLLGHKAPMCAGPKGLDACKRSRRETCPARPLHRPHSFLAMGLRTEAN